MPFEPGKSGNPNGRPKVDPEVRELARAASVDAIKLHIAIVNDLEEPTSVRQKSADAILDRAWGKPAQAHTGEDGEGPVEVNVTLSDMDRAKALAALMTKLRTQALPSPSEG